MTISRRGFVAGAVATGAMPLVSTFPASALTKNAPLKIGILTPKSGAAATIGECGLRGAQWAADRVNKSGGIAGRKVELVIEEEVSPKDTIERFRRLQEQRVECVQG